MPVTGLANLAVKVADLDTACAFYDAAGQIWITDPAGNTIELQQEA